MDNTQYVRPTVHENLRSQGDSYDDKHERRLSKVLGLSRGRSRNALQSEISVVMRCYKSVWCSVHVYLSLAISRDPRLVHRTHISNRMLLAGQLVVYGEVCTI